MRALCLHQTTCFLGIIGLCTFQTGYLGSCRSIKIRSNWTREHAGTSMTTNNTNETNTASSNKGVIHHHRRKRFDYEDNYEWEDDEDLTYEDYYEQEEEPSFFHKLATHWRTAGPRLVCVGAGLLLITIILCGCLRLACRFWCKSMEETSGCCFLPGVKQMCQYCYTDPMYERVKELGEVMGIEISFTTYEMIKEQYCPDDGPQGLFG